MPNPRTFESLPVGAVFQPLDYFKVQSRTYFVKCYLFCQEKNPLYVGLQVSKCNPTAGLANVEFSDSTEVVWLTGRLELKTNGSPAPSWWPPGG